MRTGEQLYAGTGGWPDRLGIVAAMQISAVHEYGGRVRERWLTYSRAPPSSAHRQSPFAPGTHCRRSVRNARMAPGCENHVHSYRALLKDGRETRVLQRSNPVPATSLICLASSAPAFGAFFVSDASTSAVPKSPVTSAFRTPSTGVTTTASIRLRMISCASLRLPSASKASRRCSILPH